MPVAPALYCSHLFHLYTFGSDYIFLFKSMYKYYVHLILIHRLLYSLFKSFTCLSFRWCHMPGQINKLHNLSIALASMLAVMINVIEIKFLSRISTLVKTSLTFICFQPFIPFFMYFVLEFILILFHSI